MTMVPRADLDTEAEPKIAFTATEITTLDQIVVDDGNRV